MLIYDWRETNGLHVNFPLSAIIASIKFTYRYSIARMKSMHMPWLFERKGYLKIQWIWIIKLLPKWVYFYVETPNKLWSCNSEIHRIYLCNPLVMICLNKVMPVAWALFTTGIYQKLKHREIITCHHIQQDIIAYLLLTHSGRVAHICISKLTIIGSDNGLSSHYLNQCEILLIRLLGTNSSEILSAIHTFSFKKMHLKMLSAKWHLFCLGLNVLKLKHHISWLEKWFIFGQISWYKSIYAT